MKRYYCTYFDRNYLIKALALIESLGKCEQNDFHLFVVCMDEITRVIVQRLNIPNLTLIPMHEIEQRDFPLLAAKGNRSMVEYYWTTTPTIILRILERYPQVDILTYIDADLFFFSSPAPIYEELANNSVLIHEHRFPARLAHLEQFGKYNVGLLSFRNDERGLDVLLWWRDRCNEWCYNRPENGKFGDQLYLNDWPERFDGVSILKNIGAGVAPWNHEQYSFSRSASGAVYVNDAPLIFYHFHALVLPTPEIIVPIKHVIYSFTKDILRLCVVPYADSLLNALESVRSISPDFSFGYGDYEGLTLDHTFVVKKNFVIPDEHITKSLLPLEGDWNFYLPSRSGEVSMAIERITTLSGEGKMDAAHFLAVHSMVQFPDSPDLIDLLAGLKFRMGKIEEAKALLQELIEHHPTSTAFNNLGVVSLQEGDRETALRYFAEALKINPIDREALMNRGELLMTLKRFGEAEELLSDYLQSSHDEEISCLLEVVKNEKSNIRSKDFQSET